MEESVTPYDRLDTILERMDDREKAKRRNWLVWSVVLVAVGLVGSFFAYRYVQPKKVKTSTPLASFRRFASEDLNPEKVQQYFVQDPNPIVVIHPVTGVDTIHSMDDYYQFLNKLDLIAMETELETEIESDESLPPADEKPEFKVMVEGKKQVGQRLVYTIENFDPAFELILDFGNGITRKVSKATSNYTYPLPGHFDMHLKIMSDGQEQIIQTIKYQIFPKQEASAIWDGGSNDAQAQAVN